MKRTIKTILCAATAVLAVVSCQKSVEPVQTAEEGKGTIDVRVNGLMGEYNQVDATKAELVNTVRVSWKGGETVYVYDGSKCIGSLVASLEGTEDRYAVLSTDGDEHQIEKPAQGTKILTLVYSPLLTEKQELSGYDLCISLEAQSGEKAPFVAYATLEYKGETTITGTVVPFQFATSVIKVNCTGLKANTAITSATLPNVNTACKLTLSGSAAPIVTGDVNGTITRTGDAYFTADKVNAKGEAVFQIAVPELVEVPGVRVLTVAQGSDKFTDNNFTTSLLATAKSVNTVCQLKALPAGALPGEFSVSTTKKVYFSNGNLQATYNSSTSSYAWGFAANQYTFIGNAAGNTTIDSQTNGAVVDLFGWSTASTTYGISTSISKGDYSGDFVDWGKEIGDGNTWRTLTTAEWQYLINRNGNENIRKGKYKYGVTVCKKANCLILVPDGCLNGYSFNNTKTSYSIEEWATAEAAGLVCLPAAGGRDGSNVSNVGDYGYYWSSSASGSNYAYGVLFHGYGVNPDDFDDRNRGFSVRLITECQ